MLLSKREKSPAKGLPGSQFEDHPIEGLGRLACQMVIESAGGQQRRTDSGGEQGPDQPFHLLTVADTDVTRGTGRTGHQTNVGAGPQQIERSEPAVSQQQSRTLRDQRLERAVGRHVNRIAFLEKPSKVLAVDRLGDLGFGKPAGDRLDFPLDLLKVGPARAGDRQSLRPGVPLGEKPGKDAGVGDDGDRTEGENRVLSEFQRRHGNVVQRAVRGDPQPGRSGAPAQGRKNHRTQFSQLGSDLTDEDLSGALEKSPAVGGLRDLETDSVDQFKTSAPDTLGQVDPEAPAVEPKDAGEGMDTPAEPAPSGGEATSEPGASDKN